MSETQRRIHCRGVARRTTTRSPDNNGTPTEAEIRRDMNALLHGRKDGKIVVENFSPKAKKGVKKLVDETFKSKIGLKTAENKEIPFLNKGNPLKNV